MYTKNRLVSWYDDKELSSNANIIGWNSFQKKKKKEEEEEEEEEEKKTIVVLNF